MKKIGIIGSGQVGKALAKGFLNYNYPVMIGSRSAKTQKTIAAEISGKIQAGDFVKTAQFGEILILAVKESAGMEALNSIGADHLKGKIVMDATNPIADEPPQNGVLKFFTSLDKSLMETYQEAFPETKFIKAYSCIGSGLMVNPHFPKGEKPSMFICGKDERAKSEVRQINELFGFDTEDMGGVEAARAIEPLSMLWCIPGFKNNSWSHAFKLLK